MAAIRALASCAALNLPSKPTLLAALRRCRRCQFFACSLSSPFVAHQSCFYCAKPCYAHFLIERPQIHLFADIYTPAIPSSRRHLAGLLPPLPPMQMGAPFESQPLPRSPFCRRTKIRFFVREKLNTEKLSQRGWYLSPGLGAQRLLVPPSRTKKFNIFSPPRQNTIYFRIAYRSTLCFRR